MTPNGHAHLSDAGSSRKTALRDQSDDIAEARAGWIARNRFYYEEHYRYMRFLVPPDARVLDLGCGIGDLLAALAPDHGVGVDISPRMVEAARRDHPQFEFVACDIESDNALDQLDGPFDIIIVSDSIGQLEDIEATLARLHGLCHRNTRLVISYYSRLWEPILSVAERLGQKQRQLPLNWLSTADIAALLRLAGFEVIKREWRQLLPKRLLGLGWLVNRLIAPLPLVRRLCLRDYVVARPVPVPRTDKPSASVVIPARNERGNIENAVRRTPVFAEDLEIVFVEGHSSDGTLEEMKRVAAAYPDRDIKVIEQVGRGKGDAVRAGFAAARGEVLMILDADLTTPPETMPKFYNALVAGKGDMINGTRLVYPLEPAAMRFLNRLANRAFSLVFSWLLNQRFTDTLCGTKVLTKVDYERLAAGRDYFGPLDPFGDFDLLLGAAKLNLRIVEIPVRYAARAYGAPQISRFSDGWLLLRMTVLAWRKLKAL